MYLHSIEKLQGTFILKQHMSIKTNGTLNFGCIHTMHP